MAVQSPQLPVWKDNLAISKLREHERPVWSRNGTLIRRNSRRHYVPKHPFYYTSKELFSQDPEHQAQKMMEEDTKNFVATCKREDDPRRAFSAPLRRTPSKTSHTTSPAKPEGTVDTINRPKTDRVCLRTDSSKFVLPETVGWLSTPVPGVRTIESQDLYRKVALEMKNSNIYHIRSGLLPKYMGYVPGFKFRYGSTFGNLTFNAREIGVQRSLTWGGAVSLF